MHVLHLDEQRGWRGGEQQASWLIQGLAARGLRQSLVGRPGAPFLENAHGGAPLDRVALPLAGEWDLYSAWRIGRYMRREAVDMVHAHTSHAHMLACMARRFAGRGKVVASRRVSFAPRKGPLNRWKYNAVDQFLCVSGEVARVLAEYGVPDAKRRVVYSAVDLARLDVVPLPRAKLGAPEDAPLLFNAGALVGHKDQDTLLRAFALVRERAPEAILLIAGEGAMRGELEARIRELGLGDAARLLGHREDVPRLVRAADVYVSSSWSEGLGTSVLEALACETPVVAAVAGGIPEMVRDGETGWLVPNRDPGALADAVRDCLARPDAARAMAAKGRAEVAERFSVERMVVDTLAAYEELRGA